jgi:endonuclease YncB( thermonuclease family)
VTGLPPRPWLVGAAVGLVALVGAIGFSLFSTRSNVPLANSLPALSFTGRGTLKGRATVIAADTVKVGDSRVRLTGLEAPDPDQRCLRSGSRSAGRAWSCGQDAREATQRLVQGQTVTCEVGRSDSAGLVNGTCRAGGADIAEALIRAGYAFAETGLLSSYRGAEESARASKAGIWASSEPERPAAWRERVWSAAKRQAPDGCPIKGRVRGGEREYLLPWSSDYQRVRISARRGERWFCSEEEAVAAGWRSARKG